MVSKKIFSETLLLSTKIQYFETGFLWKVSLKILNQIDKVLNYLRLSMESKSQNIELDRLGTELLKTFYGKPVSKY